jgi:hypothetical protein
MSEFDSYLEGMAMVFGWALVATIYSVAIIEFILIAFNAWRA